MRQQAAVVGIVMLLTAAPLHAGTFDVHQWGLQVAGGYAEASGIQYYALQPHVGFGVWKPASDFLEGYGIDALWLIEPWVAFVRDEKGPFHTESFEIGVSPLFVRGTLRDVTLQPFVEGGFGIVYTDLRGQDLSTRIQFTSQVGVGIQYPLGSRTALSLTARFRHMSNAGIGSSNPGVNTLYGLLGVTFR